MFSLAEATKKIPYDESSFSGISDGDSEDHAVVKLPSYEKLLMTGEVVAEYASRLITALSTSTIGVSYLHTFGVRITAAFADYLVALELPGLKQEDDSGDSIADSSTHRRGGSGIQTWCLMALIMLTGQSKTNQLVVLKRGVILWLTKTLSHNVSAAQRDLSAENGNFPAATIMTVAETRLFDMAISLLCIIIFSSEAQRYLIGSVSMQRETESLTAVLILLMVGEGRHDYHVNLVVSSLQGLLKEASTREIVSQSQETKLLRVGIEQLKPMSIDLEMAKGLLAAIESTAPTIDAGDKSGTSSGDFNPDAVEILESVLSLQSILPDNPLFAQYCSGMARSGMSFLLRYTSSAGRIFQGEEELLLKNVDNTRVKSPPIHTSSGGISRNKPKVVHTPPMGGKAQKLSNGRVVDDMADEEDEDEGRVDAKKGKGGSLPRSKNQKGEDEDEDEEEEGAGADEDEEEGGADEEEEEAGADEEEEG